MTNEVWKTGAIGDITFPGDWVNNVAPQSGDTGTIGAGQAQILPADSLPSPLTLDVGTLQGSLTAVPTSIVVDEGASLPSGLTIDDTASGGTITSGANGNVVGAALVVVGSVISDATINVGPGDVEDIVPYLGSPNSFTNDATISLNGTAGNDAALYIGPSPLGGASLSATYGSISANYGLITAAAPDSGLGIITLSNDSGLLATADISHTNIVFADGTDTLALGQVSGANSFEPVGQITGFQQGDTIALLSGGGAPAAPASVAYSGGVLKVSDASSNVLASLTIGTGYTNDGFYLSQQPSVTVPTGSASFTSQDDIALGDLWKGGDTSSTLAFNNSANWSNGVPTSGETAIIGASSKAVIDSSHAAPSSVIIDMGSALSTGTQISNWSASSTSSLAVTDASIGGTVGDTINVTAAGGTLSFGAADSAMVAGIGANGAVTDAGTINVGAGDALTIGITGDSSSASNGAFDNTGVINLVGSSNSPAFMRVKLGNQGVNSITDAYAGYGNVNLNDGIFFAEAPDENVLGATFNNGDFSLSNGSLLGVAGTVFSNSTVTFRDGAGDMLALGETAYGNFYDYGKVYGFQAGDTIALLATSALTATPTVQYDATTSELDILESGVKIGQMTLVGNYATSDFTVQAEPKNLVLPNLSTTYSEEYDITLGVSTENYVWKSGVTGDFNTASNWVNGVVPAPSPTDQNPTATLQQGTIQLGPSEGLNTPLTLDVGATAASTFAAPTSTIDVIYDNLSSGLTIDNTLSGGSIGSPSENGPVVLSALDATGTVVSGATIDIGAGDMEEIGVSAFSSASTPGVFDNLGQIDVGGSPGNFGVLYVGAGGPNNGAGATVDYGTVVVNGGAIFAAVADAPANSLAASFIPGNFYLSNGSDAAAFAPLQDTNVTFLDGTDKLALAPQSTGGTYQFGGEIYGMQVGDAIAFEENATSPQPVSISVSSGTDANGNATTILTVSDSGGNPLGSVTIEGSYTLGDFTVVQNATTPLAPFGYTGAYDVTLTTNPANIWNGATADFGTAGDWSGGVPTSGAATVASGTVQVSAADGALSGVTLNVGAIAFGVHGAPAPAANIAITDTTLAANIANTAGGGELISSASPLANQYNTPSILHLAGVQADGAVTYGGVMTVGAGDADIVTIAPDTTTTTTWGDFNNQGQIDLTGAGNNTAAMLVMQNVNSANAGGYAQYGTVNLSDGQFFAEAPDSTLNYTPSASTGTVSLSNDSQLSVANTILNDTNVVFQDGTDTLQIGEDASGQYMFGSANGMISGFQAGDTIDLLESDAAGTPTSISYDTTTDTLDIFNGSTQIGTLHIANDGGFTPTSFVGMPGQGGNNPPGANYQGEYVIKLGQSESSLDVTSLTSINNSDTVLVQGAATVETGATLSVDRPFTGAGGSELAVGGALTVNSGGTLQVGNGGITAATTVTAQSLSTAGTIDIAGAGAGAGASLTVASFTPNVLSGNVDISGNGQLVFQGGQVNELAGNLTLNGAEAFVTDQYDLLNNNDLVYLNKIDQNASLTLDNGAAVFVANSLTDSGAISIDASVGGGSNLTLGGQLQVEGAGSLDIGASGAGFADMASLGSLYNSGTISLNDLLAKLSITGFATNNNIIEGLGRFDADPQSSVTLANNNGATIDANAGDVLSLDNWSSIANNGALEANGGTLQVNASVSGSGSGVIKGDGTLQLNAGFSQGVDFQGLGTLDLTGEGSDATTVFTDNFSGAISGFTGTGAASSDVIKVVGSGGTDHVVWTQNSGSGTLQVEDSSNNVLETMTLEGTYFQKAFSVTDPASVDQITYNSSVACYSLGTSIATEDGETAVEALRIGDLVRTASGVLRAIVWIGRRSYSARFARNNPDLPPICFKAGSLADGVPARDLRVSPKHAMFLDGVLVPAEQLVNGASIVQDEPGEDIHYFHIELASHDVLIAEGAFSESFVDDDSRDMFQNAREFDALYPDRRAKEAVYCAPRVEDGFALDRIRRRLAERAGLALPPATDFGALCGAVEHCDLESVMGWARNAAFPDASVCLDVTVDGAPAGYAYAAGERPDGGRAFSLRFAEALDPAREHEIELRRSADGALLDSRLIPAVAAA